MTPPPTPDQHPLEIIEIESSPEPVSSPFEDIIEDRSPSSSSVLAHAFAFINSEDRKLNLGTSTQNQGTNCLANTPHGAFAEGKRISQRRGQPLYDPEGNNGELTVLRAEICDLKAQAERDRVFRETIIHEQKASQEALLAEIRLMREAAEGGIKRKYRDKKRSKRSGTGEKLRKYLRKLRQLEVGTEGEESSTSSDDGSSSSSEQFLTPTG